MTTDCVPGCCNHERCVMRNFSGRYLCSVCDLEGKSTQVQCRMYGFCAYASLDEIYHIASIDKTKSADSLCRTYILINNCGGAIWIEHTTLGLGKLSFPHPSTCRAYRLDLDGNEINRDECLASVDNMHVDAAFDEIIRQLAINFDRRSYRAICRLGDRDGI